MSEIEREDPLERLERKQAESHANKPLKIVVIVMAIVAAALAVLLATTLLSKNKLVGELNQDKQELTEQIAALQSDYEDLSSEYDSINLQLDSSRVEIAQLLERAQKTDATNRAKMRQYEKELGTLRTIMRSYIVQIDSLNTLNHKLTADAAAARREAAEHRQRSEELAQEVEALSGRVSAGSIVKARGLSMSAYAATDKVTDKATKAIRLLVNLSLIENELAEHGPVRVYVQVTDPDGNLLSDGKGTTFNYGGQTMEATASREVDYEGREVDLGIYVNNIPAFEKGVYQVRAYTEQAALGMSELLLR